MTPCKRTRRLLPLPALLALLAAGSYWALPAAQRTPEPAGHRPRLELGTRLADLAAGAATAPEAVRPVYQWLAAPADDVTIVGGQQLRILPLRDHPGSPPDLKDDLTVRRVGNGGQPGEQLTLRPGELLAWRPFEEAALAKLADLGGEAGPSPEMLAAAQKALVAVAHFHLTARRRPAGENPWRAVEAQLSDRLLQVRRDYLRQCTESAPGTAGWRPVLDLADDLEGLYPRDPSLRGLAAALRGKYARSLLDAGEYAEARRVFGQVLEAAPGGDEVRSLREAFEKPAGDLAAKAEPLDDAAAVPLLEKALSLCPTLPGLRDALLRRQGKYAILYVAVPALPEALSPAAAAADPERWAAQLLFEPLLGSDYREGTGQEYRPELAAQLPDWTPGGARFTLPPDARWADGRPVTSADVRRTVESIGRGGPAGRAAPVGELVQPPRITADPRRLDFALRQDVFDPLSLFTFPVLPATSRGQPLAPADPDFARKPVGSGPYVYQGRAIEGGETYAVFTANPYYARADRPGRPYIREVRFRAAPDPLAVLRQQDGKAWLVPGLTGGQARQWRAAGNSLTPVTPNRRVYFLAANHRHADLRDVDLRQALACAIDREEILDRCFRGGGPAPEPIDPVGAALAAALARRPADLLDAHHALNGPFPAGSWAVAPATRVPPSLYDPERARSLLLRRGRGAELTLKYPDGDPQARAACELMAAQAAAAAAAAGVPLTVRPVPLPPRELWQAVAGHDYDLAYVHQDYDSEFFWLWPLFDPDADALARGGSNYLGYENDATLVSLLRSRRARQPFDRLRALTHEVHAHLHERMPLIPLWQLDVFCPADPQLVTPDMEAPALFAGAAQWRFR